MSGNIRYAQRLLSLRTDLGDLPEMTDHEIGLTLLRRGIVLFTEGAGRAQSEEAYEATEKHAARMMKTGLTMLGAE